MEFEPQAEADITFWIRNNKLIAKKIHRLLEDIEKTPFYGLGKPEPLKYEYSGCWSRRINEEHRLVYRQENDTIIILSCRYYYD